MCFSNIDIIMNLPPCSFSSSVRVESAAIARLAFLCDGDARIALNSLETALQASGSKVTDKITGVAGRVITVEDIKKGLERSHVQYDRAGEIFFLLKSVVVSLN